MTTTTLPRVAAALIAIAALTAVTGCSSITQLINGEGDVFSLEIGDCYNDVDDSTEITSVPIVDCEEPHDNEVYAIADMTEDEFPGLTEVQAQAEQLCIDEFEDFVGLDYESSLLYPSIIYPTAETWLVGDRELLCALSEYDADGNLVQVTGSLEGSAR